MREVIVTRGEKKLQLAVGFPRRVSFTVKSAGCSILVGRDAENAALVYSGAGNAKVKATVEGDWLFVVPYQKDGIVLLQIPELREDDAGWTGEPSLTDLEPPPMGSISPEMQAIIDKMNRNAIIREQALLRSLGLAK